MNHISCEELKLKLDMDENLVLVNALDEARFRAMHIPNSINICKDEDIQKCLAFDDFIVIYCTDEACNRSILLYQKLQAFGYEKIFRFAGGLRAWEASGYELVGEMVA
ncbi:MAG: rhodanese-like domain-containing protein [Thermodesulfovibrionia bacterium]|nr:rhodanese-like domain-containing protein [Thermodesulfovibrionia bacterium]